MSQIATLYIIEKSKLELEDLATAASKKIDYNWSGFAFVILSVFSSELRSFDWDNLELQGIAQKLSDRSGTAIILFASNDRQQLVTKLDPATISPEELEQFSLEFSGEEGLGEPVMEAIQLLHSSMASLSGDQVLTLEIA